MVAAVIAVAARRREINSKKMRLIALGPWTLCDVFLFLIIPDLASNPLFYKNGFSLFVF